MTAMTGWENATGQTSVLARSVHVWAWSHDDLDTSPDPDISCLDADEIRRYQRFRFRPDQLRFATCHGNMRRILAGYLAQSPAALIFAVGDGGKPALVDSQALPLQFNLSHSSNFGLLAVASDLEVGVDVEEPRKIEQALAERYLSVVELQMLAELEDGEWLPGFLRCWTRKEAILKAEGVGLRLPLDAFDVSLKAGARPALLGVRPPAAFRFPWQLFDVSPAANAIASLAVSAPPTSINLFHYRTA